MRKMDKQIPAEFRARFEKRLASDNSERLSKPCIVVDEVLPSNIIRNIDGGIKVGKKAPQVAARAGKVIKSTRSYKSGHVKVEGRTTSLRRNKKGSKEKRIG